MLVSTCAKKLFKMKVYEYVCISKLLIARRKTDSKNIPKVIKNYNDFRFLHFLMQLEMILLKLTNYKLLGCSLLFHLQRFEIKQRIKLNQVFISPVKI